MDNIDSDNVVSIAKWQEKKQEEVKFIIDELGLEKLIDDLTNVHSQFREAFDLEDEPTYGDWCRLQQTLNIFEDMIVKSRPVAVFWFSGEALPQVVVPLGRIIGGKHHPAILPPVLVIEPNVCWINHFHVVIDQFFNLPIPVKVSEIRHG